MPQFTRIQVLFHTEEDSYVPAIRPFDHRIGIHPQARMEVLRDWHQLQSGESHQQEAARLTEALSRHWEAEVDQCQKQYRFLGAIGAARERLRVAPSPPAREQLKRAVELQSRLDEAIHEAVQKGSDPEGLPRARATLERILTLKPDLARIHGKLGTLHATEGRMDLALKHLNEAARCDPDDSYGDAMIGWLAYLDGRYGEAVTALRRADEIEPYNAKINHHLGLALMSLGRIPEALRCFRRVVAMEPLNTAGCGSLAQALHAVGESEDALRYARRAVRLTQGEQLEPLMALAELCSETGAPKEASQLARQALALADRQKVSLPANMKGRLEQWRDYSGSPSGK